MTVPLVYLAGSIRGLTVEEADGWREQATLTLERLGIGVLSPLRFKPFMPNAGVIESEYPQTVLGTAKGITARDRFDVMRCDALLANLSNDRPSVGTMIELGWADAFRKPIVAVLTEGGPNDHPMVREVVSFAVGSLPEAYEVLAALLT